MSLMEGEGMKTWIRMTMGSMWTAVIVAMPCSTDCNTLPRLHAAEVSPEPLDHEIRTSVFQQDLTSEKGATETC